MTYKHIPVTVTGKRAVVIGGTSGIGRAIALGFAAEGADVIAPSRDADRAAAVAEEIREEGSETIEVTCDVAERASIDALCEEVLDTFGAVDVLVNSFGGAARRSVLDVSDDEWERVMNVQLSGIYRATQVFAREMEGGSIVQIALSRPRSRSPNLPLTPPQKAAWRRSPALPRGTVRRCA